MKKIFLAIFCLPFLIVLIVLMISMQTAQIAQANCITRYFVLPASDVKNYSAILFTDNDFLPLTNLKVIPGPILQDGRQIVKAELPKYLIMIMAETCADWGISNPLTPEGVNALGIVNSYAGKTREEVLFRWPELIGQVQAGIDEYGDPVMVDKFPVMRWSCE